MAAAALLWLLTACENTGNKALDSALWNSWPKESIGHHEEKPDRLHVAALVHRGGTRNIHDEVAFRVTVDRFIRYAADLANERKASRFEITDARLHIHGIDAYYRGMRASHRIPYIDATVNLFREDTAASGTSTVLRTGEIQGTPKDQLLTLPALSSLWSAERR